MTWLLLAFTGRAVAITNQYNTPYCVAHAVATCWWLYWYDDAPETYIEKLNIPITWISVREITRLWYMNISIPQKYSRTQTKSLINKWPLIVNIEDTLISIWPERTKRHAMCAIWYDDNYLYVANSRGTGRWYEWIWRIASWDIKHITLQTLWYKPLTWSSLITYKNKWISTGNLTSLTGKKEDLQEYKQAVKSPTINANNTKKRFLKPLD